MSTMVFGDKQGWAAHFKNVDSRILKRISAVWSQCVAHLPDQPEEDDITINLVDLLAKDPKIRRICHYVEYQYEPFGTNQNGTKFSKGEIDIAFILDQDRDNYLAYECKRLNVIYDSRHSLATAYVKQGMMRFITEQYAEGLPTGCMLGYVMDGDMAFSKLKLNSAISDNQNDLCLVSGPVISEPIGNIERFSTSHIRPNTNANIEMYHALLPFTD